MKRSSSLILISMLSLFFLSLAPLYVNAAVVNTKATSSSSVDIQVDHIWKILDGGLAVLNDTVKLSTKPGESAEPLTNFLIGFPFEYKSNLYYCFAYNASNPDERLDVKLDAGLGRVGFYGVNVLFREPMNISDGGSYDFTVIFVFSDLMSTETESFSDPETGENMTWTIVDLDFPIYPSLVQDASICNVTIFLPKNFNYRDSSHTFNTKEPGIVMDSKSPLRNFAHETAQLLFHSYESFHIIDVNEIKRHVKLDEWGGIFVSDFYHIINKADERLSELTLLLPQGTYNVHAWDESGDLSVTQPEGTAYTNTTITLRTALKKDETAKFTLEYQISWKNYVNQPNWRDINLALTFLETFGWTVRKLEVTITLPEGAEFQSSNPVNPIIVKKGVFQEAVTFTFFNVTSFHDLDFDITCGHLIFWASFRPTLWVEVLVAVVFVVAFIWRRVPRPLPVSIIPVPSEDLRSFVDTYGKKTSLLSELEALEQQLRRGQIPRRRYKIRRKAMEGRLSVLSRDLSSLREKIRVAGPRYANIMRQIEIAETQLEGAETDIRRVESRYRRGEISKGAYNRLLGEYHSRRERAKVTTDGVLLRLREEIR